MSNKRGVTLIEVIIAMVIILIASLGFLTWETNMFRNNVEIARNNTAYAIAQDVADRLQRMLDNSLIKHTTANMKCVGFAGTGEVRGCFTAGAMDCNDGTPTDAIEVGATGMTKYTNPWNGAKLYLYDNNACQDKTWTDATCGSGVTITTAANGTIDHPNAAGAAYNSVNPVRYYRGVTYYAVWSVAYLPCNVGAVGTDKRKIFVTVYWIVPEPSDTAVNTVQTKLASGTYRIKSVSIVVDKTVGVES